MAQGELSLSGLSLDAPRELEPEDGFARLPIELWTRIFELVLDCPSLCPRPGAVNAAKPREAGRVWERADNGWRLPASVCKAWALVLAEVERNTLPRDTGRSSPAGSIWLQTC